MLANISRISLGTAEIGFAYGIGKRTLPTETEAITLLRRAVDLGVTFFDTANYYDLAEERIGKSGILKNPKVIVETKCAQFLEKGEYFTKAELEAKIRTQVEDSLIKLRVDSLPILLLHGPSAQQIEQGELIEIVNKLTQAGQVRMTGVSTRGEEAALAAINCDAFDIIQVAYNLADQRMAEKVLPFARQKNITVINRSVLLKGALTPLRAKLPAGLEILKNTADKLEAIAQSINLDLPTLAVRFAISNPFIATSLIGTGKIKNLEQAMGALEAGPLPAEIINQLEKSGLADPTQIDPARWPKLS